MGKEQIPFPADIREDAAFLGVRMADFIKVIIPCAVLGVVFAMLPMPVFLRIIFFLGFPAGGFIWVAADVPGYLKRIKRYRKEPAEYSFIKQEKQKSIEDLLSIKAFYGPFIEFKDNSLAVVLRLDAPPWQTMADDESDNVALGGFRNVLRDAYLSKAELLITQDSGRQLLRSEWDRQEKEYTEKFVNTSALEYAVARVNHHRNMEKSRGEECHIRIRVSSDDVELPRKPADDEDLRNMLAEILTDLVENVIQDLAPHYIATAILGAEAVRDLAARQLNPIEYQRISYVEHLEELQEQEIRDKEDEQPTTKKINGLVGRLQLAGRFYGQFKELGQNIGKLGNVLEAGKNSIINVLPKTTDKTEEYNDIHQDALQSKVITVWSPTGNTWSAPALNLAAAAVEIGYITTLLNYDLACTELDAWFNIQNSSSINDFKEKDAGLMTMGENLTPELAVKLVRKMNWGINYLPAGNKLNNIGTPTFGEPAETVELFSKIVKLFKAKENNGVLFINAGRDFEYPPTYAALSEADVIIIPCTGNPHEVKVIEQQLQELARIKIVKPTVELLFVTEGVVKQNQVCQERVEITADYTGYIKAAQQSKPYALEEWKKVLHETIITHS